MPAMEQVVIRLTAVGNTRAIKKTRDDLLKMAAAGKLANTDYNRLSKSIKKSERDWALFTGIVNKAGKTLSSLNKISLKLFTIGFPIGAAALASVNALFAAGRLVAKAFQIVMQGLSVVVAAVGATLAGAAAAMREYTAAANAYAFKSSPALKNRLDESSAMLRGLANDATLATFGFKALSGAFAAVTKNSQFNAASKQMLKGLADFAAAGGDPAKNLQAAGEFVGLLQKAGKLDQKALKAAESLGPMFVDALKKARKEGVSTFADLQKMLASGRLAELGGVQGQAGIVGGTLMGQLKAFMVQMSAMGSDLGMSLLVPAKKAIFEIEKLLRSLFARVAPEMISFGEGGVLGGLVKVFAKLEDFVINLFRKHLPGANGMMSRFVDFWKKTVYVFEAFVDKMRTLLPLGSAIIEAFGKPFLALFTKTGSLIKYLGEVVNKNQKKFNAFGQDLKRLVDKLLDVGKTFLDTFADALPMLSKIVNLILMAADAALGLAKAFASVGNFLGRAIPGGGGEGLGSFFSMATFMLLFGGGSKRGRARMKKGAGMVGGALGRLTPGMPMMMPQPYGLYGKQAHLMPQASPATRMSRSQMRAQAQAASVASGYGATYHDTFTMARNAGMSYNDAAMLAQMQHGNRGPGELAGTGRIFRGMYKGARYAPGGGFFNRVAGAYRGGRTALGRHVQQGGVIPGQTFTNFMGGMGPAMMMGLATPFMAKEAQGSMALGSSVAMLAPMLGPVAAGAGMAIGGIGTMMKSRTAAGGALGGALGGAGIGAAVGTVVPVIGTAVGAIVGAAVGAVVGYFKGRSNADKIKAKKAASKYMNTVYGNLSKDLVNYDIKGISATIARMNKKAAEIGGLARGLEGKDRTTRRQMADELYKSGKVTKEEADALAAAPGTFRRELEKTASSTTKVAMTMMTRYTQVNGVVQKTFGMTEKELVNLAQQMGVNLMDPTMSLTEQMRALGLATQYTAEQVRGAVRDIGVRAMEQFQGRFDALQSGNAIAQLTEDIYQQSLGGPLGMDVLAPYIQEMYNLLNVQNPNNPLSNIQKLIDLFGPGGIAFRPGQQLAGQEANFSAITPLLTELQTGATQDTRGQLADMISKTLLYSGYGVNRQDLMARLGTMDLTQLEKVSDALAGGAINESALSVAYGGDIGNRARQAKLSAGMGALGLSGLDVKNVELSAMTMEQKIAAFGEEGVAIMDGMNQVIQAAFKNKPDWMKNAPEWYTKESFTEMIKAAEEDDTSTPRGDTTSSRLGRTLRRHDYFDSMFAGKRTMTSSYRTTALGSINSDHVTGKAYDLTGQNLGAYATMVNRMGGFAEFHGVGGARHLHVVPGQTPVGDDTVPSMSSPISVGSTGSAGTTVYMTVNGAPGQDVNQLANIVYDRLKRAEREAEERS